MNSRKEKILRLRSEGLKDQAIGRELGISRQRVHQIRTGYISPKAAPPHPSELKILTRRKREWLGMTEDEYENIQKTKQSKPTSKLVKLVSRKREILNIPTGKVHSGSGGRDYRRELVRMRDNHTCQICRLVWQEGKRRFDIHHKDEDSNKTRQFDSVEEFENMITLCHKCHIRLHKKIIDNPFNLVS